MAGYPVTEGWGMYPHSTSYPWEEYKAINPTFTSQMIPVASNWGPAAPIERREPPNMAAEGSDLASQLQQIWLQNRTHVQEDPVQQHEYSFPIQPVFSTGSGWQLEPGVRDSESQEVDPLNDPVLNFISDMMEEDTDDRACMGSDLYQELTGLLTDPSSYNDLSPSNSRTEGRQEPNQDGQLQSLGNILSVASSYSELNCQSCAETHQSSSTSLKLDPEVFPTYLKSMSSNGPHRSTPQSRYADMADDSLNSDQEIIRFLLKEAAAQKSSQFESKVYDYGSPQSSALSLSESDFITPQTEIPSSDACSPYMNNSSWSNSVQAASSQVSSRNDETPEGLERRVAMERQNKVRLHTLLINCAKAISTDDMTQAYKLANEIRESSSPYGDSSQRLAHHFVDGLIARITGTGALLYNALLSSKPPSAGEMLKAFYLFVSSYPNVRISHYFACQTILDACEGEGRLHIVDYGIRYGFPWPCLIKALASRPGGPPHLRITGIEFPDPGPRPAERVEETGRRLVEYARKWGVPFDYSGISTNWEDVYPSSLFLRQDEVLVVNCLFRLRNLFDETVKSESPRKLVLHQIRSMRPKVFIQAVQNGCYNSPSFPTRFQEALSFYGSIFDAIDASIPSEVPERLLVEQFILAREILNIVSCEGSDRVERAESYKHWEARTLRAGFQQMPLDPEIYGKTRAMLSLFHKDHGIGQDGNWMLLGWKNRIMNALTTWKPYD